MSLSLHDQETLGDAELISAVRGGDLDAYGVLFERHVEAARRLARQLVSAGDVEDLVSESFVKVMTVLQRGGGPDVAFRAYLLTALRRLHVDRIRAGARLHTSDDMEAFDPGVPFRDTAVEGFESAAAARAFASLPERWQLVLWHTEVEGAKPADVAPLLGMSPNSVSALAYRAREGLRQAFLSQHAADIDDDRCRWTTSHLGAYVRGGTARRDATKVEDHLGECRSCMAVYLELSEVNSNLSAVLAPLLLGGAAAAYVSATTAAGSTAAAGGVLGLLDRAKDAVLGNAAASGVAGVAATVAVVGGGIVVATTMNDGGGPAALSDPAASSSVSQPARADEEAPAGEDGSPGDMSPGGVRAQVTIPGTGAPSGGPASGPSGGPAPGAVTPPAVTPTTSLTGAPATPTSSPTSSPTGTPTGSPTGSPTSRPTQTPTGTPTATATPTTRPTTRPTSTPTSRPTSTPTSTPTTRPTSTPTTRPTSTPTTPPAPLDLSIAITPGGSGPIFDVSVVVGGLVPGVDATVTVTSTGVAVLRTDDARCSVGAPAGGAYAATCSVAAGDASPLRLEAVAPRGGRLVAEVVSTEPDVDPSNNRGALVLP